MIRQSGTVRASLGDEVDVVCDSLAACARCARGEGCGGGLLGALLGARLHNVRVVATGEVPGPGTRVWVGLDEAAVLRAAALAYLPPLAGFLGLGALASGLGSAEVVVAAAALAGLVLGLTWARHAARKAAADPRLHPVLVGPCEESGAAPGATERS